MISFFPKKIHTNKLFNIIVLNFEKEVLVMMNPDLGSRLRECRKSSHLSVNYVAECLEKDYGIHYSPKTIYSWENGQNQPSADTLLILCKIYGVSDILETLGYEKTGSEVPLLLSSDEKELIKKYRNNKYFSKAVLKLMEIDE